MAKYALAPLRAEHLGTRAGRWHRATPLNFAAGADLPKLQEYGTGSCRRCGDPGMVDRDTSLSNRKPEVRVYVDRKKASDLACAECRTSRLSERLVGASRWGNTARGPISTTYGSARTCRTAPRAHVSTCRPSPSWGRCDPDAAGSPWG